MEGWGCHANPASGTPSLEVRTLFTTPRAPRTRGSYLGGQSCSWHFFWRPWGCVAGSQKEFLVAPLPLHTQWAICRRTPSGETHTKQGAVIPPCSLGRKGRYPQEREPFIQAEKVKRSSFGSDQSSSDILESTFLNVSLASERAPAGPQADLNGCEGFLSHPQTRGNIAASGCSQQVWFCCFLRWEGCLSRTQTRVTE